MLVGLVFHFTHKTVAHYTLIKRFQLLHSSSSWSQIKLFVCIHPWVEGLPARLFALPSPNFTHKPLWKLIMSSRSVWVVPSRPAMNALLFKYHLHAALFRDTVKIHFRLIVIQQKKGQQSLCSNAVFKISFRWHNKPASHRECYMAAVLVRYHANLLWFYLLLQCITEAMELDTSAEFL